MGIGNIFHAFQPKDKIFFVLFEKVTDNLVAMSNDFNHGIKDFDLNDDSMLKLMSDYEHKNDELTHEIFVELGKNFITPFDREDIHTLATGLDDIADYIYASAKYIFPLQISFDEGLCRFFITDSQGLPGDSKCDEKPERIQKYGAGKRSLY